MTLAVHRLAGAAAAIVAGGTIVLGSVFLISKSYNLPAYIATSRPAPSVFYVKTYPLQPRQPICETFVETGGGNKSARQIQPCSNAPPKQK